MRTPIEKLKMRQLIDRWSPAVFVLFSLLKGLQIFRWLGASSKEGGWRAGMRAYSRTEHSKFALAIFRLDLWSDAPPAGTVTFGRSATHLTERLASFLKTAPEVHWQLKWTGFSVSRARKEVIDVVRADFAPDGSLKSLEICWSDGEAAFGYLSPETQGRLREVLILLYNETRGLPDKKRPWILQQYLKRWLRNEKWRSAEEHLEAWSYLERILTSVMIHFETLPEDFTSRFQDPDFIQKKHLGLGLMNVFARLTPDNREADLWFQFHHIPVDGVPMQEVLTRLQKAWGVRGALALPKSLLAREAPPVLCSTEKGKRGAYLATWFLDFGPFLRFRKEVEKRFTGEAHSGFTAASLMLWTLSHHPVFHGRKFLFPADVPASSEKGRDRGIEVVFIRPSKYIDSHDPSKGFLRYAREFTRKLEAARSREGEGYEMLELYALTSPFVYGLTRRVTLKALGEFIGTVGLTIIKDAEVFITPLSEIHTDGFLAFGNFRIPVEGGGSAGAVSARGSRERVSGYLRAVREVVTDPERFF